MRPNYGETLSRIATEVKKKLRCLEEIVEAFGIDVISTDLAAHSGLI